MLLQLPPIVRFTWLCLPAVAAGLTMLCGVALTQPTTEPTSLPVSDVDPRVVELITATVAEGTSLDRPVELILLRRQDLDAVLVALGPPATESEFAMSECCSEFRIELWNTYPPDDPAAESVRIRELTWDLSGHYLTVWADSASGRWQVLENVIYPQGTE